MKFSIIFTVFFFTIIFIMKLGGIVVTHKYSMLFGGINVKKIDWVSFFSEFAGCSVGLYILLIAHIAIFSWAYRSSKDLNTQNE